MSKAKTTDTNETAAPKAPPARSTKGSPPKSINATAAVTNFMSKPEDSDEKQVSFYTTVGYHKKVKNWATEHGISMTDAWLKGMELLMEKHR